jgi:hypothetical protein
MRAREYVLVLPRDDGESARELCRTATTGHPVAGDEIVVDGRVYVVERVRHQDDAEASASDRVYTVAHLFLRACAGGPGRAPSPEASPPEVLPFRPPTPGGDRAIASDILPATLVALLVACGYREQASRFRTGRRVTARLVRAGHGWLVDGATPAAMWRLSRRAKRCYGEAAELIARVPLTSSCATGAPARAAAPSSPAARPILRLV